MQTTNNEVWFNGALMASHQACVPATHEGVKWGMGVFETLLSRQENIIEFSSHITRLQHGVSSMGYELHYSVEQLYSATQAVIKSNNLTSALARIRITTMKDYCIISAEEISPPPLTCTANISAYKLNAESPLAGIKSSSYAANILSAPQVKNSEALLFNHANELAEGTKSNIFLIKDGTLFTPSTSSGCLNGIMRQRVIKLAQQLEIPVVEKSIIHKDLTTADEVFLTNSIQGITGITAITQLEDTTITPSIGTITSKLRNLELQTNNLLELT